MIAAARSGNNNLFHIVI